MVVKSSFGNPENEMPYKWNDCRRGADPPKNESGRTGFIPIYLARLRFFSAGNSTCINIAVCPSISKSKQRLMSYTVCDHCV